MTEKVVKLVSISEYARHWGIDRRTVYKLIKEGKITLYQNKGPKLNQDEKPPVRKYGKRRKLWRKSA